MPNIFKAIVLDRSTLLNQMVVLKVDWMRLEHEWDRQK